MTKTSRYTSSTIGPYDVLYVGTSCVVKCHEQETLQGIFWHEELTHGAGFYFMTRDATPARAVRLDNTWLVVHI